MASPLAVPGGDYRVHGHEGQIVVKDVQTFIDDQQGQIIIRVSIEVATGQHLRSKCQLAFHSKVFKGRE